MLLDTAANLTVVVIRTYRRSSALSASLRSLDLRSLMLCVRVAVDQVLPARPRCRDENRLGLEPAPAALPPRCYVTQGGIFRVLLITMIPCAQVAIILYDMMLRSVGQRFQFRNRLGNRLRRGSAYSLGGSAGYEYVATVVSQPDWPGVTRRPAAVLCAPTQFARRGQIADWCS